MVCMFIGRIVSVRRGKWPPFHRVRVRVPANKHGIGYLGQVFTGWISIIWLAGKRKLTDIGLYLS